MRVPLWSSALNRNLLWRYGGFVSSVAGARLAGVLITSLTFPFLVRHLGVEMYGLWNYVVVIGAFLESVADPGLSTYLAQQVAARRKEASELLPDVLVIRLLSTGLAVAVLLLIAHFEVRPDIRELMRVYGIGYFLVNLLASEHLLGTLEMFHSRSVLAVMQQTMFAAGIFSLVWKPADVLWVAICGLGSTALTNIAGWVILWRCGFKFRLHVQPHRWKTILVPSGHYGVSSLMSNLSQRTGHIVVRWLLGDFALGIYAAAVRFVDLLRSFVTVGLNVLVPRLAVAARTGVGLVRLTKFSATVLAVVCIPLTLGLAGTAHLVVPWLLGAKYFDDIPLLRWMSPYVLTGSAASLLAGTLLYALGRHRAYLTSAAGGALGGVLLYLLLTPLLGLKGAGLAFVLAELISALIAYCFLPLELRAFWRSPIVAKALIAGLIMIAAIAIVDSYDSRALVVIATGAAVYILVCVWSMWKWVIQEFWPAR